MYIYNDFKADIITVHIENVNDNGVITITRLIHEWLADSGLGVGEVVVLKDARINKIASFSDDNIDNTIKKEQKIQAVNWHRYIRFNLICQKNSDVKELASDLKSHLSHYIEETENSHIIIRYSETDISTANIDNGGEV